MRTISFTNRIFTLLIAFTFLISFATYFVICELPVIKQYLSEKKGNRQTEKEMLKKEKVNYRQETEMISGKPD
jgi:hypothetical protein